VVRAWRAFAVWRKSRPFWGGLFTLLAALELWSIPFLQGLVHMHMEIKGIAGVSTMAMGPIMVVLALAMWLFPDYRVFAGVATLICALLSMVVSNFGGFLLGMLLGVIGGGLGFSWSPRYTPEQAAAKARAEQAYRDALAGDVPAAASTPLGVPADAAAFAAEPAPIPQPRFEAAAGTLAPVGTEDPFSAYDAEFPPPLPGAGPAGPAASPLNRQQAADPTPTAAPAAAPASLDEVPPLPSAEDTPLGA
jgi:hypothetical protein